MLALIRKDLRIYFASPIAYVTIALFLVLSGFAFSAQFQEINLGQLPEASMRGLLYFIAVVLLFISPFLTMRSFADEARLQTLELIRTSPLGDAEIVIAKFASVYLFVTVILLATIEFPLILFWQAEPDLGPILLGYLGLWLLGGAFVAVGIFMSSLVRSPMIAAILTFVTLLLLWFLGGMESAWAGKLSLIRHLESFSMGVLDLADLAYYFLFTLGFLFLTVRVQEAMRWK